MFIGFDPKYNFEMYSLRKFQRDKTKKTWCVRILYSVVGFVFNFNYC